MRGRSGLRLLHAVRGDGAAKRWVPGGVLMVVTAFFVELRGSNPSLLSGPWLSAA